MQTGFGVRWNTAVADARDDIPTALAAVIDAGSRVLAAEWQHNVTRYPSEIGRHAAPQMPQRRWQAVGFDSPQGQTPVNARAAAQILRLPTHFPETPLLREGGIEHGQWNNFAQAVGQLLFNIYGEHFADGEWGFAQWAPWWILSKRLNEGYAWTQEDCLAEIKRLGSLVAEPAKQVYVVGFFPEAWVKVGFGSTVRVEHWVRLGWTVRAQEAVRNASTARRIETAMKHRLSAIADQPHPGDVRPVVGPGWKEVYLDVDRTGSRTVAAEAASVLRAAVHAERSTKPVRKPGADTGGLLGGASERA